MSERKPRRTFTKEFKNQMVQLYASGKKRTDIIREYDLTRSTFDKWVKQANTSGSFKEKENLTPEQKELIQLRKQNKQLLMENDILKQAALIFGRKRQVIDANKHKYSISAMCKVLGIARATYYYREKETTQGAVEAKLEEAVEEVFQQNRRAYGSHRIKERLDKKNLILSRRKIRRIMKRRGLKSSYTKPKYRGHSCQSNQKKIANHLDRKFTQTKALSAVVTDLTSVRVGSNWAYICLMIDLFNREIIGHSCGNKKDAQLVKRAIQSIPYSLQEIELFHTDRGKKFDNELIDLILETFGTQRFLSKPGCPYDNTVSEATYKAFKTEFVSQYQFETMVHSELECFDYVNWWNHHRIHSSLGYKTPIEVRYAEVGVANP